LLIVGVGFSGDREELGEKLRFARLSQQYGLLSETVFLAYELRMLDI